MTTKKILQKYNIEIDDIEKMDKSELKKIVKERIEKGMEEIISKASEMKKMRFIQRNTFCRQEYITELDGEESLLTLKTRLNMLPIYGNYKGDLTMERRCPYCKKVDDTTEHLVECTELGRTTLTQEDLKSTNNSQKWRILNERIRFNLKHREEDANKRWERLKKKSSLEKKRKEKTVVVDTNDPLIRPQCTHDTQCSTSTSTTPTNLPKK